MTSQKSSLVSHLLSEAVKKLWPNHYVQVKIQEIISETLCTFIWFPIFKLGQFKFQTSHYRLIHWANLHPFNWPNFVLHVSFSLTHPPRQTHPSTSTFCHFPTGASATNQPHFSLTSSFSRLLTYFHSLPLCFPSVHFSVIKNNCNFLSISMKHIPSVLCFSLCCLICRIVALRFIKDRKREKWTDWHLSLLS